MQAGKRTMAALGLAAVTALALAGTAQGGSPVEVLVTDDGGDSFAPENAAVTLGQGGVRWTWDADNQDDHNVVQDRKLFNSGAPEGVDEDFIVDVSAGTYPYYCVLHGSPGGQGMAGEVRVPPYIPGPMARGPALEIGVVWAGETTTTGDRFDIDYRVGNGNWKHWKQSTKGAGGHFGRNGNPVSVKKGKTYSFRARSKDSDNQKRKRSEWSPKSSVSISG